MVFPTPSMIFPGCVWCHHDIYSICIYIYKHMNIYFGLVKCTKQGSRKIQEQMVNEKNRDRIELVTGL